MSEEFSLNKITAEVISDLSKSAANFVIKKLKKQWRDIVNQETIDYGTAFEKYLLESERHISMAKTILYGQTPKNLYSFFECMEIRNRQEAIDTSNVNNVLNIGHNTYYRYWWDWEKHDYETFFPKHHQCNLFHTDFGRTKGIKRICAGGHFY